MVGRSHTLSLTISMQHYLAAFKQYVDFNGRATRPQYWYFALMHFIIVIILSILDRLFGWSGDGMGVLQSIYLLAALIPSIAIGVRRLHDINKSGWMLLVGLIPFVGWIWLIVLLATPTVAAAKKSA